MKLIHQLSLCLFLSALLLACADECPVPTPSPSQSCSDLCQNGEAQVPDSLDASSCTCYCDPGYYGEYCEWEIPQGFMIQEIELVQWPYYNLSDPWDEEPGNSANPDVFIEFGYGSYQWYTSTSYDLGQGGTPVLTLSAPVFFPFGPEMYFSLTDMDLDGVEHMTGATGSLVTVFPGETSLSIAAWNCELLVHGEWIY